jgi:ubiquinone/menaquinone biosynthesis C-methylase UbiE
LVEPAKESGAVADHLFADVRLAALYDLFCGRRTDFEFYFKWVMSAKSVLDVGCGTGALLHMARDAGHKGRLCGLDPAPGMLAQARKRGDIEWTLGDLSSVQFDREFDLVVMTGHAFQVLVGDEDIRGALAAIHRALTDNGRFAFETRNPLVREWERWTPDKSAEVTDSDGTVVRLSREVQRVNGDTVSFSHTFTSPVWEKPQMSRSTLRFLDARRLSAFLSDAGLKIENQFGNWDGSALTDSSREIITIARR